MTRCLRQAWSALVVASLMTAGIGCRSAPRVEAPGTLLRRWIRDVAEAMGEGQLRRADLILSRARNRFPDHPVVRLWSAESALLRWQDRAALEDLRVVLRRGGTLRPEAPSVAGGDRVDEAIEPAFLHGRIGDLLLRMGRYGEARPYLASGRGGPNDDRWGQLAKLTELLPFVAAQPMVAVAELPLLPGQLPELICQVGQLERPFVLDTGAVFTTLTESLADEVGVSSVRAAGEGMDGMGRPFPLSVGVLSGFSLGGVALGPQPVFVVADSVLALRDAFGGSDRPPKAVIGLDVLRRFRVTFDPSRQSVVFETARGLSARDSMPCLYCRGQLVVPVQIDGHPLWLALDTGASHSSLNEVGLKALPGGSQRVQETMRRVYTPGGFGRLVRQLRQVSCRIGDGLFELRDVPVVVRDSPSPFPVHGVLGVDVLGRCRVTIDSGRCRISLLEN